MAKDHKNYNSDGKSSEDRALDRFTDMLIEKIQTLQGDWKKPWFSENSTQWPKESQRSRVQRHEQPTFDDACRERGLQASCMGDF